MGLHQHNPLNSGANFRTDDIKAVRDILKARRASFFQGLFNIFAPGENLTRATITTAEKLGVNDKTLQGIRGGVANYSEEKVAFIREKLAEKRKEAVTNQDEITVKAIDQLNPIVLKHLRKEELEELLSEEASPTNADKSPSTNLAASQATVVPLAAASFQPIEMIVDGVSLSVPSDKSIAIRRMGNSLLLKIDPTNTQNL